MAGRPYTVDLSAGQGDLRGSMVATLKMAGDVLGGPVTFVVSDETYDYDKLYLSPGAQQIVITHRDYDEPVVITLAMLDAAWASRKQVK
ncbi:MAG: hypothetical protein AB8H79_01185 [Myxococcota bacterium]